MALFTHVTNSITPGHGCMTHRIISIKRVLGAQGSKSRGFTLMELMVVVAIIAFVTAAVVPSFSMALQKGRQREAGNLIVQAIFAARSRAARTGRCHRVRIYTDTPGVSGGSGGMVGIDESNMAECSRAVNLAGGVWSSLGFRTVAGGSDPEFGGNVRAGLVGQDVAITDCNKATGSRFDLHFEPTGNLYLNDAIERKFRILAYQGDGVTMGIENMGVLIRSSGSVQYTILPAGCP